MTIAEKCEALEYHLQHNEDLRKFVDAMLVELGTVEMHVG